MKKLLTIFFLSFSLGLLLVSIIAYASQTNMSTYYPSPNGTYTKVHLINQSNGPNENYEPVGAACFCAINSNSPTGVKNSNCDTGEAVTYTNAGTIFADSSTGYLEICKNDGSVATYPGSCFNRFGTCPSSGCVCPNNYQSVTNSNQPFPIGGAAVTWTCCLAGSGSSSTAITKSGCFSIYSTLPAEPASCKNTAYGGDPNAYDVGCEEIGSTLKRDCCFNATGQQQNDSCKIYTPGNGGNPTTCQTPTPCGTYPSCSADSCDGTCDSAVTCGSNCCTSNQTCSAGQCVSNSNPPTTSCTSNANCSGGQECNLSTSTCCTPTTCTANSQCGSTAGTDNCGYACNNAAAGTCTSPATCNAATHQCSSCTPVTGVCTAWSACSAGYNCGVNGTQTCTSSTPAQCGGASAIGKLQLCTGSCNGSSGGGCSTDDNGNVTGCNGNNICCGGSCHSNNGGNQACCGTSMVDESLDDNNCGDCGKQCSPGQACTKGACLPTCGDTPASSNNNSAGCPGTQQCCSSAMATNGQACTDTTTDIWNCGGCGKAVCPTQQICQGGACICPSNAPDTCGSGNNAICVDKMLDNDNCGDCGTKCNVQGEQECSGGTCACPSVAPTYCGQNDGCVDTQTDANDCGGCYSQNQNDDCALDSYDTCTSGQCTCSDEKKKGTNTDCGACDDSCPDQYGSSSTCDSSTWECMCPGGADLCTDDNCASCGDKCANGEHCSNDCSCTDSACPDGSQITNNQCCDDSGNCCAPSEMDSDGYCPSAGCTSNSDCDECCDDQGQCGYYDDCHVCDGGDLSCPSDVCGN